MALDTRRILLPLAVLMGLLLGVFVLFEKSYSHLSEMGLHISRIQDRQRLLAQVVRSVYETEAAQSAYVLEGDEIHLHLYTDARSRADSYLSALEDSYSDEKGHTALDVGDLSVLIKSRLQQLEQSLQLYKESGRESAASYALAGAGGETMSRVRETLRAYEGIQADALVNAWTRYLLDLHTTRMAMAGATALNLLMLALVGSLLWRTLRGRAREAQDLQRQVDERTRELTSLSSYLQEVSEREKQQIARELHDSLGGLLVATKMDVAWLRSRLPTEDENLLLRWRRIQQSLDKGVDLKRRVVEQLRPTLLDNMGLYAALRWQIEDSCGRAGMRCIENLPEAEIRLTSEASIALFRVAQESLTNILKHSAATEVQLRIDVDETSLSMVVSDNGRGLGAANITGGSGQGLAGMRHRIRALGGTIDIGSREEGGTEVRVRVPLKNVLMQEGAAVSATPV